MKRFSPHALLAIFSLSVSSEASAFVKEEGWLIAEEACIATRSLRASTGEQLELDRAYRMLGKNKAEATHYQIRLDPESKADRWVKVSCGIHVVRAELDDPGTDVPTGGDDDNDGKDGDGEGGDGKGGDGGDGNDDDREVPPRKTALLLAVSWQPAFCETRPDKKECRSQHEERFDASNFTLHGLWPQPRDNVYCDVDSGMKRDDKDRRWDRLPLLDLTAGTRTELNKVMPGTASFLHRHEWVKHGTCYSEKPETYYRDSLRVMEQLNNSDVKSLFAANVGQNISTSDIHEAFEKSFGAGSSQRVQVTCKNDGGRRLITELKIHLAGPLGEDADLAAAIGAGDKTSPGCNDGIVDPVGLQ
ncbi:ribonuclease T2 [Pelagibius sp. Alg239-R121]|uniref:ribonuclease T2 n=1 Tax=Pelagibius sp. Alg239-R121 TaxID=2993448 RepID=UPI0024A6FD91|nr:ribonuclease T2 [Pelagibius sp. Alg239-R121]